MIFHKNKSLNYAVLFAYPKIKVCIPVGRLKNKTVEPAIFHCYRRRTVHILNLSNLQKKPSQILGTEIQTSGKEKNTKNPTLPHRSES